MARQNLTFLMGTLAEDPMIRKNGDEYLYATVRIVVARGTREVGDERAYMKCDNPVIMTRDKAIVQEMEKWKAHDAVFIKGTVATRTILKGSICRHCGQRNYYTGALVYINPIFVERTGHCDTDAECLEFLENHREISNQVYVFGTLCRDPGKVKSKYGFAITQYQIAMTRKYRIRTDPPEMRTDWPWVKTYGANAEEDFKRLRIGAEVFLDGCLQARSIMRKVYCGQDKDEKGHPKKDAFGNPVLQTDENGKALGCGKLYEWKDRVMEIVPYEVEYINGYRTDEELMQNVDSKPDLESDSSEAGELSVEDQE